ncbi:MAG: CapA family protein [Anaerolineales bacterium]|nr:CapA family protein [Anaerolineales bacterium]
MARPARLSRRAFLMVTGVLAACGPAAALPTATAPPPPTALPTPAATAVPPTASETTTSTPTSEPTATPAATATKVLPAPSATPIPTVRLLAGGDIMLARSVGDQVLAQGPNVVFASLSAAVAEADLFVANLECVISDQGTPAAKAYTFRAPPAAADALSAGGLAVVSLANNHSLDYGVAALADMLPRLRGLGIATVGAGADDVAARAPVILERQGLRIAFLAYVDVPVEGRTGFDTRSWQAGPDRPGLAWAVPGNMQFDIASARLKADVVVVLLHFGQEGQSEFTDQQQELAHAAVDAGAALVLGAHSHVLQPLERYNGGLIAYSLGNLVFDGFAPPATYSALLAAALTPAGVVDYAIVPLAVDHGLPRPATDAEAAVVRTLMAPPE